jgi:hypothetical protein
MTTTELLEVDNRIGKKLDSAAALAPTYRDVLLVIRRQVRAELERRHNLLALHAAEAKQQWFGLTLHPTGDVSFN